MSIFQAVIKCSQHLVLSKNGSIPYGVMRIHIVCSFGLFSTEGQILVSSILNKFKFFQLFVYEWLFFLPHTTQTPCKKWQLLNSICTPWVYSNSENLQQMHLSYSYSVVYNVFHGSQDNITTDLRGVRINCTRKYRQQ